MNNARSAKHENATQTGNPNWWRGAIVYQIYPRSFQDSNGDGVGDLAGITSRLNYIASLGVDAIWISPFFTSPMKDFGYDISNYRDVDPLFGALDDFKTLLARAHELNIKVLIDQVISHSSDQHPWFAQSRHNRTNDKADWYVWADPKVDGTAPNNWLSFFGGSAWSWEPRRKQYYLHNFLTNQPDLNFHNKDVQDAQLANIRFWLELGVDGLRLDVVNFYFHDEQLRDNPPNNSTVDDTVGVFADNPYAYQIHQYDVSRPENIAYLKRIRKLCDEFGDITTIGEINAEDSLGLMAEYTSGQDRLHMAYTFDLFTEDSSADYIRSVIQRFELNVENGWPCWSLSNHDVARVLTRWGKDSCEDFTPAALALLMSLKGSVCLYQGEELGFEEAEVNFEDIVDPYGLAFWPEYKGRDGCRTPMAWDHTKTHGGFTNSKPWLPADKRHIKKSAAQQKLESNSVLNRVKNFILWRKQYAALQIGDIELIENKGPILAWIRKYKSQSILCVFNLTPNSHSLLINKSITEVLSGHGFTKNDSSVKKQNTHITLEKYQAFFALIE